MIDTSRENVLRIIHWLEARNPMLRRGDKPLPTITVHEDVFALMTTVFGPAEAMHAIMQNRGSSGVYNMATNELDLHANVDESVLVHELVHFLQPSGMTDYECEELAYGTQAAWQRERGDYAGARRSMRMWEEAVADDAFDKVGGKTFDFRNPPADRLNAIERDRRDVVARRGKNAEAVRMVRAFANMIGARG